MRNASDPSFSSARSLWAGGFRWYASQQKDQRPSLRRAWPQAAPGTSPQGAGQKCEAPPPCRRRCFSWMCSSSVSPSALCTYVCSNSKLERFVLLLTSYLVPDFSKSSFWKIQYFSLRNHTNFKNLGVFPSFLYKLLNFQKYFSKIEKICWTSRNISAFEWNIWIFNFQNKTAKMLDETSWFF